MDNKDYKQTEEEKTYKKFISRDYSLLYSLLEEKISVICFMNHQIDVGIYRKMEVALDTSHFGNLYLAYEINLDSHVQFCKNSNLTFIDPTILTDINI